MNKCRTQPSCTLVLPHVVFHVAEPIPSNIILVSATCSSLCKLCCRTLHSIALKGKLLAASPGTHANSAFRTHSTQS